MCSHSSLTSPAVCSPPSPNCVFTPPSCVFTTQAMCSPPAVCSPPHVCVHTLLAVCSPPPKPGLPPLPHRSVPPPPASSPPPPPCHPIPPAVCSTPTCVFPPHRCLHPPPPAVCSHPRAVFTLLSQLCVHTPLPGMCSHPPCCFPPHSLRCCFPLASRSGHCPRLGRNDSRAGQGLEGQWLWAGHWLRPPGQTCALGSCCCFVAPACARPDPALRDGPQAEFHSPWQPPCSPSLKVCA